MEKHCCQTLGHDASGGTVHSRDGQPPLDIFAPLKKMPVQWSHSPGAAPSKQSADPCPYQAGGIASAGTLSWGILSWECTQGPLVCTCPLLCLGQAPSSKALLSPEHGRNGDRQQEGCLWLSYPNPAALSASPRTEPLVCMACHFPTNILKIAK